MIYSEEGLQLALEQLGRLERALDSLTRDVLPKSEDRFRLLAEPYSEKIEEIRGEIEEYRTRSSASSSQTAAAPSYLRGYSAQSAFLLEARFAFAA